MLVFCEVVLCPTEKRVSVKPIPLSQVLNKVYLTHVEQWLAYGKSSVVDDPCDYFSPPEGFVKCLKCLNNG